MFAVADGDYYRLLADGDYEVTVTAPGYHTAKKCVTIENKMYVGSGDAVEAQVVNFVLSPEKESVPDDEEAAAQCQLLADVHKSEQQAVEADADDTQDNMMEVSRGNRLSHLEHSHSSHVQSECVCVGGEVYNRKVLHRNGFIFQSATVTVLNTFLYILGLSFLAMTDTSREHL